MPVQIPNRPGRPLGGSTHNWDEWFKKKQFVLVKGRDFKCKTLSMVMQINLAARAEKRRLHVSTEASEDGNSITVTVHGPRK